MSDEAVKLARAIETAPLAMSVNEALEIEGESDADHRAVARRLAVEVGRLRAEMRGVADALDLADSDEVGVVADVIANRLRRLADGE